MKRSEWLTLIGLLVLSFVPAVGGSLRLLEIGIDSEFLPENPRITSAPLPMILHLSSSTLFCILGAIQFLTSIRLKFPKWHQKAGKVFVASAILSAFSGLWMAHYYTFPKDLQGDLLYWVRMVVGFSLAASAILGLLAILKKRITEHRAWMLRAYAIGLGAGTQVFITIPWLVTVGEPSGFTRDVLMTLAWVINLVVAELIIDKTTAPRSKSTVKAKIPAFYQSATRVMK